MCDPTGGIATALAIGGTALSAGSSIYGGYAQASASRSAAAVADQNAQLARQQTNTVEQQGADEALQKYRQIHDVEGQQVAGAAAAGLDVSFGTPGAIVAGTATLGQEDVQRLRQTTQDRANALLIDAGNYQTQAATDRATAGNDITSGFLKAGGSILSGATQIAGKMPSFGNNTTKVFDF